MSLVNPSATNFYDYRAVRSFIEEAAAHYDRLSPQLVEWLDELYIALNEAPLTVSVFELMQLQQLAMNGEWEHHNYAQNRWYKVRAELGKDCGVLSF